MGDWCPIESAPERTIVLVYGTGGIRFGYLDENGNWRGRHHGPIVGRPSHWQPLPAPPATDAASTTEDVTT